MGLNDQTISYLVERGRLERITPRRETADHLLREARRHLVSAASLAETDDTSMAFSGARRPSGRFRRRVASTR